MNIRDYINKYPQDLAKLIASWNVIEGASANHYQELADKIFLNLTNGCDEKRIHGIVSSQFTIGFGLWVTEFDPDFMTEEIFNWWNKY